MDSNAYKQLFDSNRSSDTRTAERGLALILCIGFLALLSILGATVLNLTNSDLQLTTRDRRAKDIFYTADRAVEYALSPSVYTNLTNVGDQVDLTADLVPGGAVTHKSRIIDAGKKTDLINALVTYEGFGGPPSRAAKYDKTASAGKVYRYFHISVEASSDPPGQDRAFIDAQVVQVFPTVSNVPVTYASGKQDAPSSGGN